MTSENEQLFRDMKELLDACDRIASHGDDVSALRYDDAAGKPLIFVERRKTQQNVWVERRQVSDALLSAVSHEPRRVGIRKDGTKSKVGPGLHRNIANYLTEKDLICFHPETLDHCRLILSEACK